MVVSRRNAESLVRTSVNSQLDLLNQSGRPLTLAELRKKAGD